MSNEVSRRFASHKTQTILRAKVVVVGSAAVGKTTLLHTLNNDVSNSDLRHYKMTARTDIVVGPRLPVNEHVQVEFHFYDCGGSTIFNFKQEASQYWEDPEFVVVVYDVSDKESFRNVEACHRDVCATCGTRSLPGLLVANKTDLSVSSRCEVETAEGKQCAENLGLKFVEANYNYPEATKKAFEELAKDYAAKHRSFRDSL